MAHCLTDYHIGRGNRLKGVGGISALQAESTRAETSELPLRQQADSVRVRHGLESNWVRDDSSRLRETRR